MSAEDFSKLGGMELIGQLKSGERPIAAMNQTMNVELVSFDAGTVTWAGTPQAEHLNPMGIVHGGWAAAMMDTITGVSGRTVLEPGESFGTLDLQVKMLRPLKPNVRYTGVGTVITRSRKYVVTEGRIMDPDDRIMTTGTATLAVTRSEP